MRSHIFLLQLLLLPCKIQCHFSDRCSGDDAYLKVDLCLLTLSYFRKYIYTYEIPKPLRLLYTDFAIKIWGFYLRLKDTLWYQLTSCSRVSGLLASITQHVYQVGRKVKFTRSCPLFLASFGKLRLSDQVKFIAWHGIQRQIIWMFCRESEVSGQFDLKTVHSQLDSSTKADDKTDMTHVRVFILTNSFSKFPYFY